jgi:hypothetical protein
VRWEKLGLVYKVDGSHEWMQSHAMLPTPLLLDDRIRVYFCSRDKQGMSRITFADLDRGNPLKVLGVGAQPLLPIGKPGTFDDSGTLCTFAIRKEKSIYLYYNGYNRRVVVPWSNAVGLAVSEDEGTTFTKKFEGPVLDRTPNEPYFAITPWIVPEGGTWHMWYTSCTGWALVKEKYEPLYHIKYAHSIDGVQWHRPNRTCIAPLDPLEANARGAVVRHQGKWRMWFCYRGSQDFRDGKDSYKIGYAESDDAVNWVREDARAGIAPTPDAWDSSMQAYPALLEVGSDLYMFYNGNGFGASGFGVAVLR